MARRGAFIVIEGLDRSGKTSQTTQLKERLMKQGKKVELIKFPGLSPPFRTRRHAQSAFRKNYKNWRNDQRVSTKRN